MSSPEPNYLNLAGKYQFPTVSGSSTQTGNFLSGAVNHVVVDSNGWIFVSTGGGAANGNCKIAVLVPVDGATKESTILYNGYLTWITPQLENFLMIGGLAVDNLGYLYVSVNGLNNPSVSVGNQSGVYKIKITADPTTTLSEQVNSITYYDNNVITFPLGLAYANNFLYVSCNTGSIYQIQSTLDTFTLVSNSPFFTQNNCRSLAIALYPEYQLLFVCCPNPYTDNPANANTNYIASILIKTDSTGIPYGIASTGSGNYPEVINGGDIVFYNGILYCANFDYALVPTAAALTTYTVETKSDIFGNAGKEYRLKNTGYYNIKSQNYQAIGIIPSSSKLLYSGYLIGGNGSLTGFPPVTPSSIEDDDESSKSTKSTTSTSTIDTYNKSSSELMKDLFNTGSQLMLSKDISFKHSIVLAIAGLLLLTNKNNKIDKKRINKNLIKRMINLIKK
jgi:hypothetical protein